MYSLNTIIKNIAKPSLIPEVAFHPDGTMFAATYGKPNHEIHVFDTTTFKRKHVLKNPNAELIHPHGILMTNNHLIVTNVVDIMLPSIINVYRLDSLNEQPVHVFEPDFKNPIELHSIDIYENIVVMTCCQSSDKLGAVVSYHFNDDTGEFSEPIDIQKECFKGLGDTKGITFNDNGTRLYITFESDQVHGDFEKFLLRLSELKDRLIKLGLFGYIRGKIENKKKKDKRNFSDKTPENKNKVISKNGIVVLDIGIDGKISHLPSKIIIRKEFCRYENVKIYDKTLLITDTINNKVLFFDLASDPDLEHPIEILTNSMTLPHGVKLSPDQSLLVVSNYGLKTIGKQISWNNWTKKRGDNILIFKRN